MNHLVTIPKSDISKADIADIAAGLILRIEEGEVNLADVYKAIFDIKQENPDIGEKLISTLQKHKYYWAMTFDEVMWLAAHLPWPIWDRKVHTLNSLYQSQQTTTNP